MQWHPIFAYLLRPLVESHYEVRIDQPVGDLPRKSDVVLLRKSSDSPPPFLGLWSRLTSWNVLEYKGPTVSPRFDELHDLLELGLGVHRRLNELQAKEKLPELDYPEVSFWYLVNHMGRRFLADLPGYLPDVREVTEGVWLARLFSHPVLLVSVQELRLERDSMVLHALAGVPEAEKTTITEILKAEPALWPSYGTWFSLTEPTIWQEIALMAAQQSPHPKCDLLPLTKYLLENSDMAALKSLLEAVGLKRMVEVAGVEQTVAAIGEEDIVANLSPERRERLRQLLQAPPTPTTPEK